MKRIVIIGGGTGTYTLLSGLKKYPAELSVIVSTADDGGSSGVLRNELGVFPPGDIRQCLLGLSNADQTTRDLFSFRFDSGELKGHNLGNLIIAGLEKVTGSIEQAIAEAGEMLKVKGAVIPATVKPATLVATLENGKKIIGEHNIDEPKKNTEYRIQNIEFREPAKANPAAIHAVKNADVIVFGPGDLYTSILPNVLTPQMVKALAVSKAKKVLATNLMSKHGQTDGFKASDFVQVLEQFIGKGQVDTLIVNDQKPSPQWLDRYHQEGAEFIWPDTSRVLAQGIQVIADNFLADYIFKNLPGDKLKRSLLRHNSEKLAKTIWELV